MGRAVVHFEIGGPDAPELHAFYAKQFGWKVDASNPMQYGVVDTKTQGKGINGGICPPGAEGPQNWVTIYMEVPSIEDALAEIEQAGGRTVLPRTVIPDMVTFAQFSDPAGNLVGLVEAMPEPEPPVEKPAAKRKAAKKKAAKKKAAKKKAAKKKAAKKVAKAAKKVAKAAKKVAKKARAKAAKTAGKKAAKKASGKAKKKAKRGKR